MGEAIGVAGRGVEVARGVLVGTILVRVGVEVTFGTCLATGVAKRPQPNNKDVIRSHCANLFTIL